MDAFYLEFAVRSLGTGGILQAERVESADEPTNPLAVALQFVEAGGYELVARVEDGPWHLVIQPSA